MRPAKLLVSPNISAALRKALAVFETVVVEEQQEVHVVCSATTAMMVLTEADVAKDVAQVARQVEPICNYPNGVVVFLSPLGQEAARQALQLHLLLNLGLKSVAVTSLDQAAELAERLRKTAGTTPVSPDAPKDVSEALMCISHVSKKRAAILLDRFQNLKKIALAPESELVAALGKEAGASVHNFFAQSK
jgi:hypothetical protein